MEPLEPWNLKFKLFKLFQIYLIKIVKFKIILIPIVEDVDYLDSQLAPEESIPSHEELELEAEMSLQARIIQEGVTTN